jgi:AcrR family transcriptional regulator
MKTRQEKARQDGQPLGDLCDTVAHTPSPAVPSSAGLANMADPRAQKSGQALRAALLGLLERKPFEQITVREIASEAGVHYATFFRHHPTKEALLDAVAADQIDSLVGLTLPVLDAVDWQASFLALAEYVEAHRDLWTILLTGGAAGAMRAELLRVSQEVANERAPRDIGIPVELSTICTVSLIVEIVSWWLRQPPGCVSVPEVAALLYRIVLSPVMRGEGGGA